MILIPIAFVGELLEDGLQGGQVEQRFGRHLIGPLVYTATKQQFLSDVQDNAIHSKVLTELKRRLRHSVAPSEIDAWRNSMQFMANILVDQDLSATAGVSIEYQLQLSSKRIDFILSGQDAARRETAVIIELKQWSEVAVTAKDAVDLAGSRPAGNGASVLSGVVVC